MTGISSGVRALMPAQQRTTVLPRPIGKISAAVRAVLAGSPKRGCVRSASVSEAPRRPPPISTAPFGTCLNDRGLPIAPTAASQNGGRRQ